MSFKLPCLTMKANIPRVTGLPLFQYADLKEITVVRQGSFGVVWKAKHHDEETDAVVIKKLSESEESGEDQKEFVKEARTLYNINHKNVVKFKAFCQNPYASMFIFILQYLVTSVTRRFIAFENFWPLWIKSRY